MIAAGLTERGDLLSFSTGFNRVQVRQSTQSPSNRFNGNYMLD